MSNRPRPGTLAGPKCQNRHSTMTPEAEAAVRALKALPEVSRIRLSIIRRAPPGQRRCKAMAVTGGLRLAVRGVNSVQILYVYTTDSAAVLRALEAAG